MGEGGEELDPRPPGVEPARLSLIDYLPELRGYPISPQSRREHRENAFLFVPINSGTNKKFHPHWSNGWPKARGFMENRHLPILHKVSSSVNSVPQASPALGGRAGGENQF